MITNLSQQLRQFRNGRKPRSPHQNFRSWIVAYNRRIRILMSSSSLCLLPFLRFAYSSFFTLPTPLSSLCLLLFLHFSYSYFFSLPGGHFPLLHQPLLLVDSKSHSGWIYILRFRC